jgi:hypothetical protein
MKLCSAEQGASPHASAGLCRIVVIGDTVVSEQGMATVVARDERYLVCRSWLRLCRDRLLSLPRGLGAWPRARRHETLNKRHLFGEHKPRRNIFRKNATPMAMCVIKPHQILAQTTTGEAHMVSFCASPWDLRLIRREEKLWAPNNQRQP